MKIRMRIVLLSLLCALFVSGMAQAADESSGFIFRLTESAVMLSDGGAALPDGVDEV